MTTVCMYTPSADGGHALYTRELLTALCTLARGRYNFELVTSADLAPEFRSSAYPIHAILPALVARRRFPTRFHWGVSRVSHYWRRELIFLKWLESRPDVTAVHFQEWTPWLAASLFRRIRRLGKQIFYTVHNVVPHRYPPLVPRAVMHAWIRRACRRSDGLFVHTESLAEQLTRFLDGRHPPISVVRHGVWSVAQPVEARTVSLAERMAGKRLLFFGTIRRNKGLDLLLRAFDRLPDFSLTIAGERLDRRYFHEEILPLVRRLQSAGARIDLRDRYIAADEIPALFTSHSAIVLPYSPGFVAQSGVAFMALAYGLPIVASSAGGLHELMRAFKVGLIFPDWTPASLEQTVRALHAADPAQLESELCAAKRRYSWQGAAATTLDGYLKSREAETESDACAVETTVTQ